MPLEYLGNKDKYHNINLKLYATYVYIVYLAPRTYLSTVDNFECQFIS